MDKYFDKFPTITYNGHSVKNIMLRTKILDRVYNKPEYFNRIELNYSERADNIAYELYGDQYLSWLLYLSNEIVDPYYQWYLSQEEFDSFIVSKYGSVEIAQNKVAYWSNNWYEDQVTITKSFYDNTLPDYRKQYYEPVFIGNSILEYKRKEIDWTVNTNQIWEYSVTSDPSFVFDEKVTVAGVANGQVLHSNSSVVRVHQVFGVASNNFPGIMTGLVSNNSVAVSAPTLILTNIPVEEQVFWSPTYYYDIEETKNNSKQTIKALDANFSSKVALELKRLLNQ
jgi:hypothetical protein